jgi:hypothetical protein
MVTLPESKFQALKVKAFQNQMNRLPLSTMQQIVERALDEWFESNDVEVVGAIQAA